MKKNTTYQIDIFNLGNQEYHFTFKPDDGFFNHFENALAEGGQFSTDLTLTKTETVIQLKFFIKGFLRLICDRSLEIFDYPIEIQETLVLPFGKPNHAEWEEGLEYIDTNATQIDVQPFIYELVSLSIPMKKLHPRFVDALSADDGNEILIYSSSTSEATQETLPLQEKEENTWQKALKQLKKNLS